MSSVGTDKLSSSLEDYLEAISLLSREGAPARVKEIADHLKVKMPSVTGALKVLRDKGLVHYEKSSAISLTEEGQILAEAVAAKHEVLLRFLHELLLLEPERAEEMACRLEHAVDCEAIVRLERLTRAVHRRFGAESWQRLMSLEPEAAQPGCVD